MNVADAVHAKRAVREFAARPLTEADIAAILEAGRRAHSAKNRQRWAFIVVRDRERLRQLSTLGQWCTHVAGAAAAVALVTPDPRVEGSPLSVMWDLGGAAAQMMLVAWERGIGSCPATVYEADRARELLGYPPGMHCEFMLSFGYPAKPDVLTRPNRPGGRLPIEDLAHVETWTGPGQDAEAGDGRQSP
ncbi:MAG TPA: nitroreductase family protein [Candidatus Limnocylindrales bacterium]